MTHSIRCPGTPLDGLLSVLCWSRAQGPWHLLLSLLGDWLSPKTLQERLPSASCSLSPHFACLAVSSPTLACPLESLGFPLGRAYTLETQFSSSCKSLSQLGSFSKDTLFPIHYPMEVIPSTPKSTGGMSEPAYPLSLLPWHPQLRLWDSWSLLLHCPLAATPLTQHMPLERLFRHASQSQVAKTTWLPSWCSDEHLVKFSQTTHFHLPGMAHTPQLSRSGSLESEHPLQWLSWLLIASSCPIRAAGHSALFSGTQFSMAFSLFIYPSPSLLIMMTFHPLFPPNWLKPRRLFQVFYSP